MIPCDSKKLWPWEIRMWEVPFKCYCMYRPNSFFCEENTHDDIIKWKHFPRYWPFVRGIHRSPVKTGEFPAQRPVTRSFDVFFDLHPNKRLCKQWRGWWFETPSCPLWRHCNAYCLLQNGSWGFRSSSWVIIYVTKIWKHQKKIVYTKYEIFPK